MKMRVLHIRHKDARAPPSQPSDARAPRKHPDASMEVAPATVVRQTLLNKGRPMQDVAATLVLVAPKSRGDQLQANKSPHGNRGCKQLLQMPLPHRLPRHSLLLQGTLFHRTGFHLLSRLSLLLLMLLHRFHKMVSSSLDSSHLHHHRLSPHQVMADMLQTPLPLTDSSLLGTHGAHQPLHGQHKHQPSGAPLWRRALRQHRLSWPHFRDRKDPAGECQRDLCHGRRSCPHLWQRRRRHRMTCWTCKTGT